MIRSWLVANSSLTRARVPEAEFCSDRRSSRHNESVSARFSNSMRLQAELRTEDVNERQPGNLVAP